MIDGLLIVDKAEGSTSADVVRQVKRALQSKTGHLGTLDPFATGVLPICLGEGTKIAQFLAVADKEYEGTIRLGAATDTGDRTGTVTEERPLPEDLSPPRLAAVAESFRGQQMQTPPMYSAIKKDGTPLYKLARQGVTIERQPRPIRIDRIALEPLDTSTVAFRVACSKGTYVRVLAEDIAMALGTVGHVQTLRRTAFGLFRIEAAIPLDRLPEGRDLPLISLRDALQELRELILAPGEDERVRHGDQGLLLRCPAGTVDGEAAKLIAADGRLLAVVTWDATRRWQYARVINP